MSDEIRQEASSSDDLDLIARAQSADAATRDAILEELYRRHYPTVVRWCLRFTGNEDAAADLAQECFLRAHRALPDFRGQCKFSTWLYTIVRRSAINRSQSAAVQRSQPLEEEQAQALESPEAPVEELYAARERVSGLLRQVAAVLDGTEREVLRLRFGAGLTLPEIGRLLLLENQSGAKAYLQSAMRKLRRALADSPSPAAAPLDSRDTGGVQ